MKLSFTKVFTLILLIAVIVCCTSKNADDANTPKNILSEEAFTKVIVAFALAESASNLNVKNVAIEKMDTLYAFNPLKEFSISKGTYDSTIAFYANHPALYKKVYENVLVNLSKLQIARDSAKVDSISK